MLGLHSSYKLFIPWPIKGSNFLFTYPVHVVVSILEAAPIINDDVRKMDAASVQINFREIGHSTGIKVE